MSAVATVLGGIGLFLLGMILLTDGLKTAAGASLRRWLTGLTRGPAQAMATGAGITAMVQSSSATTVATIGFVSAGMLTFPQALGVIMGANLGTTSTGWIVAILGLKLSIGTIALPMVGVGALLRLLTSGRRAQLGLAVAGFGLIFVGIDVLQDGMTGLAQRFDPTAFPSSSTPLGILLLTLLGAATTVVMQSSSAAVATTLTALHAGTLDMPQAIYLVVGQNVGTTVNAALAAIGASVQARRTAVAHILFNIVTAGVALLLLPFTLPHLVGAVSNLARGDLTLVIAGFHTAFNVLGVLLFWPIVGRFAAFVERLIPERGPELTRNLDRSMIDIPAVGLAAARSSLRRLTAHIAAALAERLAAGRAEPGPRETDPDLDAAIARVREFLGSLDTTSEGPEEFQLHVALFHAIDHIDRLLEAVREAADPSEVPEARAAAERLEAGLRDAVAALRDPDATVHQEIVGRLAELSVTIADERRRQRAGTLQQTARKGLSPEDADDRLHTMRWVDRLTYHLSRTVHHLSR